MLLEPRGSTLTDGRIQAIEVRGTNHRGRHSKTTAQEDWGGFNLRMLWMVNEKTVYLTSMFWCFDTQKVFTLCYDLSISKDLLLDSLWFHKRWWSCSTWILEDQPHSPGSRDNFHHASIFGYLSRTEYVRKVEAIKYFKHFAHESWSVGRGLHGFQSPPDSLLSRLFVEDFIGTISHSSSHDSWDSFGCAEKPLIFVQSLGLSPYNFWLQMQHDARILQCTDLRIYS